MLSIKYVAMLANQGDVASVDESQILYFFILQKEEDSGTLAPQVGAAECVAVSQKRSDSPYATTWLTQLVVLTKRAWLQTRRETWKLDVFASVLVRRVFCIYDDVISRNGACLSC